MLLTPDSVNTMAKVVSKITAMEAHCAVTRQIPAEHHLWASQKPPQVQTEKRHQSIVLGWFLWLYHVHVGAALAWTGDTRSSVGDNAVQCSHHNVRHVVCQHLRAYEYLAEIPFVGPPRPVLSSRTAAKPPA